MVGLYKDPEKHIANLHNISAFDFLQANIHKLQLENIEDTDNTQPDSDDDHGTMEPKLMKLVALSCLPFDQTARFYSSWPPS